MDKGEYTVTIKRGSINISTDRTDLIVIDQTHDGIAFSFKYGIHIQVTDQFMPTETKDRIKAADSLPKGNIIFDLNNYNKPVHIVL